ncbi:YoaK family protein [Rhodococcus sp. T2V]|uniref:YoaK family protein n=1 Tax=Rhodococcus sp. T2V TaxID=3034164 RepID=UPI0023E1CAD8|nr:YoaK family protein [Rhodococcus sp. T2V]MDF3311160.1 YoaK family protein [Rhodococcus sp. T2V]
MAADLPLERRWLVGALLVLTVVTGLVDAVSYLRLGHAFVANMTGNVVFMGFSLQQGSGVSAPAAIVAILAFAAGAVLGGRLGAHMSDRPRLWLTAALGMEAAILASTAILSGLGILVYSGHRALVTVAVLAVALGLQNSTVRRLGAPDLTTTVLTLTLTGLAADSVLAGGPGTQPHRRLGSVAAMFIGAAIGAVLLPVTISGVIAITAVLVAATAVVFMCAPRNA